MKGLKSNGELQQRLSGVFPGRTPDADPFLSHASQRTAQQAKPGAAGTFIGIFSEFTIVSPFASSQGALSAMP